MTALSPSERDAVATLCLMAAFADGRTDDAERERLRAVSDGLGAAFAPDRYSRVLTGQARMEDETARLVSPAARLLAYEMAVAVCDADGVADAAEQAFLARLQTALALDADAATRVDADGAALASALAPAAPEPALPAQAIEAPAVGALAADAPAAYDVEIGTVAPADAAAGGAADAMILRYAVLNGALELLPQAMATLAIVPLQTKMVYRIGARHGVALDQAQARELLAAVGLGMASQVVESYARGLLGGLVGGALGKKKGKKAKKVAAAAVGVAMSFASTYALGRVAEAYYGGGRRLDATSLRGLFEREVAHGQSLYAAHRPAIEQQAQTIDLPTLLAGLRGQGVPAAAAPAGRDTGSPAAGMDMLRGLLSARRP